MKAVSFVFLMVAGCGDLLSFPGEEFRVELSRQEISVIQQVEPYELEFSVRGCDDFVTTLGVSGSAPRTLDAKPLGGGRFTASIPLASLHGTDEYCLYDFERPQQSPVTLEVTCRQDGRIAKGYLTTRYAPAWRTSFRGRGPVDAVFAGASPERFYEVGSGWFDVVEGTSVASEERAANGALLAAAPDGFTYLWSPCPINDCGMFWFVDTPQKKSGHNADLVQMFDTRAGRLDFWKNIPAPGGGFDFAPEPSGSVLLSRGTSFAALTRFTVEGASVIAVLEGEEALTKFGVLDGTHVFLAETTSGLGRLRRVDGSLVSEFVLPGAGTIEHASLAPTGDAWVIIRGGQAWISTLQRDASGLSAVSVQLATELTRLSGQSAEDSSFGTTWTTSGLVLRDQSGVEMFSRSAPFARKWKTLIAQSNVRGAVGVGESVALLTSSGLQFLDPNGAITGGADPIGPGCALDYYARHLAVVAPGVVALAGSKATYQLRVGGVSAEVSR